ncbi:MAG TPA: glycosyltransferase family 39 protein [Pyrinomonadaceae bacterium]|jgi:4-amino-4-deoxy-L-arabinose transferase-like glycosyltransferase|nr:glycosyltransferase family 39 protein [Pyrinomonadaceae bacterium]
MSSPRTQNLKTKTLLLAAVACAIACALYAWGVPGNPPGFYIDESSIAYNAQAVSRTGADEYGEAWPLYFRAFGDYKNPVFVYLLAAVFRVTGPSMMVARLFSATLGALAALLLGLLAVRLTKRVAVGLVVALSALLTPWLYESSRLVFEVAAYPLAVVLFLLALRRASERERWARVDVASLAATLALLTYTYSVGRLLAPLLAAGLALFVTRRNLARVALTWAAYALALAPLVVFNLRNPGALTERFQLITYLNPESGFAEGAREFILHYLADVNPVRWLSTGEPNIRDHMPGAPALLAATLMLACAGVLIVLLRHRREAWWRFQLYALAVSVVPAALTVNDFPQLRLIAFPVFLHVLAAPAVAWTLEGNKRRRAFVYVAAALLVAQGAQFQWLFHTRAPERWYVFDARFPAKILSPALAAADGGKLYLQDPPGRSGYIQALWHGTLRGVEASRFVRLSPNESPPRGAVVVSTEETCANCLLLARSINYIVYAVPPADSRNTASPLRPEAMRASISCSNIPQSLVAGTSMKLDVLVRNTGGAEWPAVGDAEGGNAVRLRDRWLKTDGSLLTDEDGTAHLNFDMEPGDTSGLALDVRAPNEPGEYVLELDVVQEGVARFGSRGSQTFRANVKILPPDKAGQYRPR